MPRNVISFLARGKSFACGEQDGVKKKEMCWPFCPTGFGKGMIFIVFALARQLRLVVNENQYHHRRPNFRNVIYR